jgi:uroporphyrin-III C-methyltransferase
MESPLPAFPAPQGGASLLLSLQLHTKIIVVVGSGPLAASRAFSALEADASVVVLAKGGLESACEELRWRAQVGQLTILDLDSLPGSPNTAPSAGRDAAAFQSYVENSPHKIWFVFVTDTLLSTESSKRRSHSSAAQLYRTCSDLNILVNVTDMPDLCDFSFTSTHRFESEESGKRTALQIGVTTNGKGCRLAGRLRREIVAKLPKDVGMAVENIGKLRALIKAAEVSDEGKGDECLPYDELNEDSSLPTPNRPVPSRSTKETAFEGAKRRMKWVAQVSEYWPMSSLAKMTETEMEDILNENGTTLETPRSNLTGNGTTSMHSLALSHPRPSIGRIFLVGSGPGHPSLLTLAAFTTLTKFADLVLSDKLVPDAVLAMVHSHVEVRIARKFPGNAEGAQNEMMEAAVEAARKGLTVVRVRSILFYFENTNC